MDISHIELIPGFCVIEHTPGYTVLDVPSGFRIKIKRMGPYMFDVIDRVDLEDPGEFMITVTLLKTLKPPGIEQTILYVPPRDDKKNIYEPDREQFEQAWMYYKQWQVHEYNRGRLAAERGTLRFNFALRNCVEVLDGPIKVDDEAWVAPIIDMITEFNSVGDRYETFLKTQVMSTPKTTSIVNFLFRVEEVTIEGLKKAFDSFWSKMARSELVAAYGRAAGVGNGA